METQKEDKIDNEKKISVDKYENTENIPYDFSQKEEIILGSFNEAPKFNQDNEFIKRGYLLNCNSMKKTLKSLFMLHNETINIWSHLLGSIFFILLIFYTAIYITNYNTQLSKIKTSLYQIEQETSELSSQEKSSVKFYIDSIHELITNFNKVNLREIYSSSYMKISSLTNKIKNLSLTFSSSISNYFSSMKSKFLSLKNQIIDLINLDQEYILFYKKEKKNFFGELEKRKIKRLPRWPIFIFLISAILCLSFSASFHSFGNISAKYHNILNRFDYGGISLLITGSCFPPNYYFFYYDKVLKYGYLSFLSVFGLWTFGYSLTNSFNLPKMRTIRGIIYLAFGISAGLPIVHMAFRGEYIIGFVKGIRLLYWFVGGFSYIFGAILYIIRFPEKLCPGKFDYFGASHQLFHILVFCGAFAHFIASLDAYYYRFDNLNEN